MKGARRRKGVVGYVAAVPRKSPTSRRQRRTRKCERCDAVSISGAIRWLMHIEPVNSSIRLSKAVALLDCIALISALDQDLHRSLHPFDQSQQLAHSPSPSCCDPSKLKYGIFVYTRRWRQRQQSPRSKTAS